MREKWKKQNHTEQEKVSNGHPIPQRLTILSESMYKPKLLLKSPSMRAIKNYNNLSIVDNNTQNTYDNLSFIPESENIDLNSYNDSCNNSSISDGFQKSGIFLYDLCDYNTTIGSSSVKTSTSATGSELDSEKNEMGSTVKLVQSRMRMSCKTWLAHLKTVLCTLSLAAGFGNLYRLPQTATIHGGVPFLVAYVILTILVGLPLLFLELGIGQLAQEGFIKSWRAVPFFKGVGFVKLIAGCLLSIYYPLYMGLSLYYIIWLVKGPLPFDECVIVKMKETGYSANGIDGQHCLRKTFLKPPSEDPCWYGMFSAILFIIWVIVTILSIRRTKSFTRSLSIFSFPIFACLIALTVKSVMDEKSLGIHKLVDNIEWNKLYNAEIWYYAVIQVFFSTNVGFGTFVTNAGLMYNKVNPLWTALGYTTINIILGIGSVVIVYILSGNMNPIPVNGDVAELHLISLIYTTIANDKTKDVQIWAIVAYVTFLLAGFISMATITYTLLKAITVENKRRRLKWWQTSIVLSFIGFVASCGILLKDHFQLVHLLDHYIVGNLILISVIIEVFALIAFYGTERIKSDFEFMLGHILSNIWLVLWWTMPVLLTIIFAWALITLPLEGLLFTTDPEWLFGTGWAVVLMATLLIFIIGFYTIFQQEDGYTFMDKYKASLKPSHKWGPKDPMLRHTWVQWNTKAKQGERDFTLKRKGTRDYTRSIKKNAKKAQLAVDSSEMSVSSTPPKTNDQNQNSIRVNGAAVTTNYVQPYNDENLIRINNDYNNSNNRSLRVTSLVDTLRPTPTTPSTTYVTTNVRQTFDNSTFKTNLNPLARTQNNCTDLQDGSSEGYGTFRKGPYIIPDSDIRHVCHRRYSQSEDATEL